MEWLEDLLPTRIVVSYRKEIEQAKAMEKQQILDAYKHDLHHMFEGDAEQYYNQKFVNNESKKV